MSNMPLQHGLLRFHRRLPQIIRGGDRLPVNDFDEIAGLEICERRGSQDLLIESPTHTLLLTDQPDGNPLAIVTLHDILRAQVAMSDREG